MNNCTIFNLQSSVDVVAPKFGYIPVTVTESADLYIRYKSNGDVYILENNGSYFTVNSDSEHKTKITLEPDIQTILHVNTSEGCTVCIDRNKIMGIAALHSIINLDDVYGSSFIYLLNNDSPYSFGDIINIINGQKGLDNLQFSSTKVVGDVKKFVEKAVKENCSFKNPCFEIHVYNVQSQINFDGINYNAYYIKEEGGLIKVASDKDFTTILGSYNGTNWV